MSDLDTARWLLVQGNQAAVEATVIRTPGKRVHKWAAEGRHDTPHHRCGELICGCIFLHPPANVRALFG